MHAQGTSLCSLPLSTTAGHTLYINNLNIFHPNIYSHKQYTQITAVKAMADPEVATKAPESDQQPTTSITEPSAISAQDTRAQSGPAMGEHCATDRPLDPNHPPPTGETIYLNDVATYVSKPASYPQEPGKLLLLLTGGTGLHSTNNQLQADAYAARGFLVVMPDQFGDDAAPNTGAVSPTAAENSQSAENNPSLLERVKMGAAETAKSFMIDMWLARQTPEKVLPILSKALVGAREQFADAVANGGGVYGVGYCVGGKYLLHLLGNQEEQGQEGDEKAELVKEPELKAGAIAHGAMVTKDDLEGVRRPLAMVCVSEDSLFPDDVREQGKAALELNSVEHDVRVFDGVPHGFAVTGDYGERHIQSSQAEAFKMMCDWLERY